MKRMRMKGKTVDEATRVALEVLGGKKEDAKITVLSEGKAGVLGIGGEEAEVEVILKEGITEDAKQVLQEILDKMAFLAVVEGREGEGGRVELNIKGEDMGRIIGKGGTTLRALELIVGSIMRRIYEGKIDISIDAGEYKQKRKRALERLAREAAEEVSRTGEEKVLPHMSAGDRRIIHMFFRNNPNITTFSKGEGRERRLIIAPRK